MNGKIILKNQEETGKYDFRKANQTVMTIGFKKKFGEEAGNIAEIAINEVAKKYSKNADYLQVLEYQEGENATKFWIMLDDYGNGLWILTVLLPEEY